MGTKKFRKNLIATGLTIAGIASIYIIGEKYFHNADLESKIAGHQLEYQTISTQINRAVQNKEKTLEIKASAFSDYNTAKENMEKFTDDANLELVNKKGVWGTIDNFVSNYNLDASNVTLNKLTDKVLVENHRMTVKKWNVTHPCNIYPKGKYLVKGSPHFWLKGSKISLKPVAEFFKNQYQEVVDSTKQVYDTASTNLEKAVSEVSKLNEKRNNLQVSIDNDKGKLWNYSPIAYFVGLAGLIAAFVGVITPGNGKKEEKVVGPSEELGRRDEVKEDIREEINKEGKETFYHRIFRRWSQRDKGNQNLGIIAAPYSFMLSPIDNTHNNHGQIYQAYFKNHKIDESSARNSMRKRAERLDLLYTGLKNGNIKTASQAIKIFDLKSTSSIYRDMKFLREEKKEDLKFIKRNK